MKLIKKFKPVYEALKRRGMLSSIRNSKTFYGNEFKKKHVNLEYWKFKKNLGDAISPVVVEFMLAKKGLSLKTKTKKTHHLCAIGSIIGSYDFDAVIWGSGIHNKTLMDAISNHKSYVKYDVRLVRGPRTRQILVDNGYKVEEKYGDPALIMPLIYKSEAVKKYDISVVLHMNTLKLVNVPANVHKIDIETDDYKFFIDELVSSKKVITSSLHGIILAESYGVPAVFLSTGMDDELMKFYDYYESTNRSKFVIAKSIEEAIKVEPTPLADLSKLQDNVIETFPYDLWLGEK